MPPIDPKLIAFMKDECDFDWRHVEAFPSVLHLLYGTDLLTVLGGDSAKIGGFKRIKFHRLIDNAPITMSAEDFWIELNYQVIHLTDFISVSNWPAHSNDSSFILFRKLYKSLTESGKLEAKISCAAPPMFAPVKNEQLLVTGWLLTLMPTALGEWMTAQSIRKFSEKIGHDMKYELVY